MIINEVARQYAKAIFEISVSQGSTEKILTEMRTLGQVFSGEEAVAEFMNSPVVSPSDKIDATTKALGNKVTPELLSVLKLMAERNRLSFVAQMAFAFEALSDARHGVTRGEVKSASPLSAEARNQIEQTVTKVTGKKVILSFTESSQLLGGMMAQVGGWTFDDSLSSHLRRMNEELNRRSN